jgi:hypothetical protein
LDHRCAPQSRLVVPKSDKGFQEFAVARAAEELGFVREVKIVDEGGKETTELQYDGDGGLVGFLKWAALHHTAAFLAQLGRILPLQVHSRTEKAVKVTYRSVEEVTLDLKRAGFADGEDRTDA